MRVAQFEFALVDAVAVKGAALLLLALRGVPEHAIARDVIVHPLQHVDRAPLRREDRSDGKVARTVPLRPKGLAARERAHLRVERRAPVARIVDGVRGRLVRDGQSTLGVRAPSRDGAYQLWPLALEQFGRGGAHPVEHVGAVSEDRGKDEERHVIWHRGGQFAIFFERDVRLEEEQARNAVKLAWCAPIQVLSEQPLEYVDASIVRGGLEQHACDALRPVKSARRSKSVIAAGDDHVDRRALHQIPKSPARQRLGGEAREIGVPR